jgi:hypothetical protein
MRRAEQVLQLKVQLQGIRPPIWRRIQVPATCTFWELHCAVQDSMGWFDSHLHVFEVVNRRTGAVDRIGVPDPEFFDDVKADWTVKVRSYLAAPKSWARYLYDFGDGWEHRITLEKVLPKTDGTAYPACVTGRRACPPEDCGGVRGYSEIVRGQSEFQEEYADYDPDAFDCTNVVFEDPDQRLEWLRQWR